MNSNHETKKSEIRIPLKTEHVTPGWLSQILGIKINPCQFFLTANVSDGTGYLSNLLRITCTEDQGDAPAAKLAATDDDQEDSTSDSSSNNLVKEIDLIVKLLPAAEPYRSIVLGLNMDQMEIQTYKKVLPEFIRLVPELEPYLCKHLYAQFGQTESDSNEAVNGREYGSVLVLEDLKPKGYEMIDFGRVNMTMKQTENVVDFLARFHSASKIIEAEKSTSIENIFPFLRRDPDFLKNSPFYISFSEGLTQIQEFFQESPDSKPTEKLIKNNFQNLIPCTNKLIDLLFGSLSADSAWKCIVHADLWSNNILFKKRNELDPAGTEPFSAHDFKIIDWQLLSSSDATFDLGVLIFSSLSETELTKENIDNLLKLYFKRFVHYCKERKIEIVQNELEFCKHFYTFGIMWTFLWFVLSLEAFLKDLPRFVKIMKFLDSELNASSIILEYVK